MANNRAMPSPRPLEFPTNSRVLRPLCSPDPPALPYIESETEPLEIDRPELLDPRYNRQN